MKQNPKREVSQKIVKQKILGSENSWGGKYWDTKFEEYHFFLFNPVTIKAILRGNFTFLLFPAPSKYLVAVFQGAFENCSYAMNPLCMRSNIYTK